MDDNTFGGVHNKKRGHRKRKILQIRKGRKVVKEIVRIFLLSAEN
jgi:hypothetical protein